MLVHKRREWDDYENEAALSASKTSPSQDGQSFESEINRPLRSKCLILVLTVAFFAAVVTAQSAYIVKSGYILVETKREIMQLEKDNETLKLDIAKLKAHERIAQIASQKLDMIIPQNAYFSSQDATSAANGAIEPPAEDKSALEELLKIGQTALKRE